MKRLMALTLSTLSVLTYAQIPDYVPTNGLVAWYPFNGNADDESGSGFHGEVYGPSQSQDRFGIENACFSFDGASHITVDSDFDYPERSVSLWAKAESNSFGLIFDCDHGGLVFGLTQFGFGAFGQAFGIGVGHSGGNNTLNSESNLDEWHFLTFTRDADTTKYFINGASRTSGVSGTSGSTGTWIGVRVDAEDRFFHGSIDDIGIWNRALSEVEVKELFNAPTAVSGCTDPTACNYDSTATWDAGNCVSCVLIASFCGPGTAWDSETQTCVVANPADINNDGCVQLGDLLDVLSAYGDCGAENAPWACGDPLSYQGYDYATVQIGDQCWFAENLQAENYRNGEVIPTGFPDSEWGGLNVGAQTIYGEAETCGETYVGIDGCDAAAFLNEVGRLYNWFAVDDPRGLCPAGWHVSSDEDWLILAEAVGGDSTEAYHLKATTGWYSGVSSNSSGFTALPGGHRSVDGSDIWGGLRGYWWTSTPSDPNPWHRRISMSYLHVGRNVTAEPQYGFSVRCLKDPE